MLIAITGGIGSGKSEVLKIISGYARTLSADEINAELFYNTSYINRLRAEFPEAYREGKIDKKILSDIIFSDKKRRDSLNALAHPLIFQNIEKRAKELGGDVFVEVPLLTEIGSKKMFDRVWLVVSDVNLKVERLKNTRKMTEKDIFSVMNAQCGDDERIKIADEIIRNNGKPEELRDTVIGLYRELHK
ncbi:MAG: dephospho-CoA kinase [Clostridiales bacterium]|jgi:dephospho-CoA kinase|nr:dephospho-CoA kinase [Clostridiales bacterium]